MRIIKTLRVEEYARAYAGAAANLERWITLTKAAVWTDFKDVKQIPAYNGHPLQCGKSVRTTLFDAR
jgi:hypothetical protein